MLSRRTLLASSAMALSAAALPTLLPRAARAEAPMPVVASFSILADMVRQIGGAHVAVTSLVGPGGDAHVYSPTPADARALAEAKLLFINGLDFEGFIDRLIEASGYAGERVVATALVDPIPFEEGEAHHDEHADHDGHGDEHAEADHDDDHHHGAWDPHAWLSASNAILYARAIAEGLAKADPVHAAAYTANRDAYIAQLEALDAEIHAMLDPLPESRRTIVTSHDALQYFGRAYGLTFLAPQGLSTNDEPSAREVAEIIAHIREDGVSALFVDNIADPRLLQRIAEETGANIGGTLYADALSGPEGPAATYLDMMRHNARTLGAALGV